MFDEISNVHFRELTKTHQPRIPLTVKVIISLELCIAFIWILILTYTGSTYNEWIMFLSNLGYFLPSIAHAYLGMYFESFLWFMVFVSSNNYHICYGNLKDLSFASQFGRLCGSMPEQNVYSILIIDLIFANMANVNGFLKLMPVPYDIEMRTNFGTRIRQFLTIITGFVAYLSTLIDGSAFLKTFDVDNSSTVVIGVIIYILFLWTLHIWYFYFDSSNGGFQWSAMKEYYHRNFHMFGVYIGIGILFFATFLWRGISLIPILSIMVSYYQTHPGWHFAGQISIMIIILSYRFTPYRNESIFDRYYEESRME
jgi:hypothetical protein